MTKKRDLKIPFAVKYRIFPSLNSAIKIIALIFIISIVLIIVIFFPHKVNFQTLITDSKGFTGLIGVIIGGLLTSGISYWLQHQEIKTSTLINKKITIYEPLYDEFLGLKVFLQETSYPHYFETDHTAIALNLIPKLSTWNNIKEGSEYLEVPKWITNLINKFYMDLDEYNECVEKARDEIVNYLEPYYLSHTNIKWHLMGNINHYYLKSILLNNFEIFKKIITRQNEPNNENEIKLSETIWLEAKYELQNLSSVQQLKELYEQQIVNTLQYIINTLKNIIIHIESKYEFQNDLL